MYHPSDRIGPITNCRPVGAGVCVGGGGGGGGGSDMWPQHPPLSFSYFLSTVLIFKNMVKYVSLNKPITCQNRYKRAGVRCSSVVRAFAHGAMGRRIDPLNYFSFQPVLHDWYNKDQFMCYPVCGMVHIKEPLLLIGKSSLCGGSWFPSSLSEWSLTICLTPYNRK